MVHEIAAGADNFWVMDVTATDPVKLSNSTAPLLQEPLCALSTVSGTIDLSIPATTEAIVDESRAYSESSYAETSWAGA